MKIGLVIPTYNRWDLVHTRLYELFQHAPKDVEIDIILVDDASPEEKEIRGGYAWWQKQIQTTHTYRYYRNEKNVGFGCTCNNGAKIAAKNGADILIFLSTDVASYGDFISPIIEKLEQEPQTLVGGRYLYWDTGWNKIGSVIVPYVEGWLIACTVEVWNELGGFDPRYAPYDYEDVDLSATAAMRGIKLHGLELPFLRHLSGQTISTVNPNRIQVTENNRRKFIEKWGGILEMLEVTDERGDA